ncbi:MAG: methyltransferase domain-containing protein [bacterium]
MAGVVTAWWARQLGHPRGLGGRVVGAQLDKRNRENIMAAVDLLDLNAGEVSLDIGFGGGLGLTELLRRVGTAGQVHGVDISTTMLARARRTHRDDCSAGRLRLDAGSITALPLDDASVDAAITVNTIYFVDDLDRAFAEVARVLRPGGRLVVGLGDPAVMHEVPVVAHGFRVRPVAEVTDTLARAGLSVTADRRVGTREEACHLLLAQRAG